MTSIFVVSSKKLPFSMDVGEKGKCIQLTRNISHNHMAVQFVVKLQLIAVHITTSVFVVSSKKLLFSMPGLRSYNNR